MAVSTKRKMVYPFYLHFRLLWVLLLFFAHYLINYCLVLLKHLVLNLELLMRFYLRNIILR